MQTDFWTYSIGNERCPILPRSTIVSRCHKPPGIIELSCVVAILPGCVVARDVVQRLWRVGTRPTWRHLEKAWPGITDGARNRIRAGKFETGMHEKTRLPWVR